jgi:ribosomal protein S11
MPIKHKYSFGPLLPRTAKVYMKFTYSNVFITLTDMSDKAIICHSAGSAGVIGTRKAKKAPHVVDMIVKKLQFSLIKFKIKCIIIFVRRKAVKAMNYLIRSLARFGIKIISSIYVECRHIMVLEVER